MWKTPPAGPDHTTPRHATPRHLRKERPVRILLLQLKNYHQDIAISRSCQECVVEMGYLRGACDMTRWEGESNESMYEKCGMGPCVDGVEWSVVQWHG